jgi:AAA15 family ATPase/GTPase
LENNHLTYFKVENFKKFESLEVNDIGQFNLIVGDNNVGKTCLLEALLFDENNLKWASNLHQTLYLRGINFTPKHYNLKDIEFPKISYFNYILKNVNERLNITFKSKLISNTLSIEYQTSKQLKKEDYKNRIDNFDFQNLEHWLKFFKNDKFIELQFLYQDSLEDSLDLYWPFINFNLSYSNDLEDFIRTLDKKRNEDDQKISDLSFDHKIELIKILNKIFNIEIVDYSRKSFGDNGMISIATKDNTNYIPITQFGDGFNKIFRYIVEIMYVKEIGGDKLMIDEIDTGIHHSKLKDFWINIFKVCKELDVQLFATTHSKECSEAFVEAAKSLDQKIQSEIRLIELYESKGNIYSGTVKEVDNIEYSIKNLPFRGENIYG